MIVNSGSESISTIKKIFQFLYWLFFQDLFAYCSYSKNFVSSFLVPNIVLLLYRMMIMTMIVYVFILEINEYREKYAILEEYSLFKGESNLMKPDNKYLALEWLRHGSHFTFLLVAVYFFGCTAMGLTTRTLSDEAEAMGLQMTTNICFCCDRKKSFCGSLLYTILKTFRSFIFIVYEIAFVQSLLNTFIFWFHIYPQNEFFWVNDIFNHDVRCIIAIGIYAGGATLAILVEALLNRHIMFTRHFVWFGIFYLIWWSYSSYFWFLIYPQDNGVKSFIPTKKDEMVEFYSYGCGVVVTLWLLATSIHYTRTILLKIQIDNKPELLK